MRRYLAVLVMALALLCLGLGLLMYCLSALTRPTDGRVGCLLGLALAAALLGAVAAVLLAPAWRRAGLLAAGSLGGPLGLLLWSCGGEWLTWPTLLAPLLLCLPPALLSALLTTAAVQARQILRQQAITEEKT